MGVAAFDGILVELWMKAWFFSRNWETRLVVEGYQNNHSEDMIDIGKN